MKFLMHFTQPFARDIGVHFRRADAGVSEKFLEVRREAMTQHVWSDVAPKAGAQDAQLDPQPERHRREALWQRTLAACFRFLRPTTVSRFD